MSPSDTIAAPAANLAERARAPRVLRLNPADNLVVAIDPVLAGAVAEGITALSRVPKGHKMATVAIAEGEPVRKFGQIIGFATQPISTGRAHPHPQLRRQRILARLPLRRGRPAGARAAARRAPHLPGLPPQERQGRHAQLYRRADQRELLGDRSPASSPTPSTAPTSSRTFPTSTASCPSSWAAAAAWPGAARRATRCCSAPSGAMPAIPTSPAR